MSSPWPKRIAIAGLDHQRGRGNSLWTRAKKLPGATSDVALETASASRVEWPLGALWLEVRAGLGIDPCLVHNDPVKRVVELSFLANQLGRTPPLPKPGR
jgi:hypothetical protein